jgi:hypothetical protein
MRDLVFFTPLSGVGDVKTWPTQRAESAARMLEGCMMTAIGVIIFANNTRWEAERAWKSIDESGRAGVVERTARQGIYESSGSHGRRSTGPGGNPSYETHIIRYTTYFELFLQSLEAPGLRLTISR